MQSPLIFPKCFFHVNGTGTTDLPMISTFTVKCTAEAKLQPVEVNGKELSDPRWDHFAKCMADDHWEEATCVN